ncbi:GTP cyclohydrolase II RibA [Phreatobacter stygius]|uniref:GTP cyclohydrolase-2 n=1 Tax=Phreatobacter stygius TaxID=1940610 RepID=A0A4D7B0V6_9HYPH|nr:GTP cyclohydrolase II RibA [Phreatobacter stygius]QCI63660.1 GTP cyclohydrolase II RibA [Phreatobacter stygius]
MTDGNGILGSRADLDQTRVERALAEFRAARPVLITGETEAVLVCGVEGLEQPLAEALAKLALGTPRLVLPAARLRRLGLERTLPGRVALPSIDLKRIEQLALVIDAKTDAPVAPVDGLDETALELARLALTVPVVVAVPVDPARLDDSNVERVSVEAVKNFRRNEVRRLRIVGRAPVPLEGAPETEFVVFRGGEGLRDQVAIVVGKPDLTKPVPVRLHSACLTGDLFGSLKCDCGDQLRGAVEWMAKNGGGVLLYLDQEGRGNGIANKMRAYKLQSLGFDTYDADEVLGFDLDQRHFDFAAEMLKKLGVAEVDIMTNNPVKVTALREAGLHVVSERRVIGRPTDENVRYLASKRERAGHFIDTDALFARLNAGE